MNAGRFDEPIEIWGYTTETNSYGEPVKTDFKVGDAWARVEYISGSDPVTAEKREHQQFANITLRYDAALSVYNEIKHNGKMFKIITISEIDRRMYLKLYCEQSY